MFVLQYLDSQYVAPTVVIIRYRLLASTKSSVSYFLVLGKCGVTPHRLYRGPLTLKMAQDRSDYYFDLHGNGKSRYEEKLVAIDLPIDLFSIQEDEFELSKDFTKWPDISYADIF